MATQTDDVLQDIFKGDCVAMPCPNIEATKSAITKVLTRTTRFQERVRRHISENYTQFMPNHTSPDIFLEESASLGRETNELTQTIANEGHSVLAAADAKLDSSKAELHESLLGLRVSEHILKIDDFFQCIEEAKATKDYLVVLDLLGKLRGLIYNENHADVNKDVDRVFQQLQCYDTMKVKYHVQAHLLQQNLQERFDRLVLLNYKTFPTSKCVTLQISKDDTQLQDIVMALFQAHYNPINLSNFLWEHCVEPLILKPVLVEYDDNVDDNGINIQLTLSYATKESDTTGPLRPNYRQVFEHLKLLLQTLSSINISVSSNQHVFSIIGEQIKERMLPLLVNECLVHAVPETMEEYTSSTLCEDVANFEHYLADTFLINPEHDSQLTKFTEHYDSYFCNRLNERVLESARSIMQRDLQDMTIAAERNLPTNVASDSYNFPRCMVSKSVLELIKLMELVLRSPMDNALQNGIGNEDNDKTEVKPDIRFVEVISIVLNTYIDEMPRIHKKLLESIPQQSVLFHNNCLFLAHWVTHNANKHVKFLSAIVNFLQSTGNKHFQVQVEYQQSILIGIMNELEFENAHTLGMLPLKLVRQCLRQLELLKNVWQNVLPDSVYNVTFCELINTFINELIKRIFTLRDISATMACELSDLIDVVLDKAPTLFKEPHGVLQVRSWQKFQQLKQLMNASLKEFTELWCEGVGPLTANYKADEIKQLIRALFQDTDRRAKAITQIV